MPKAFHAGQLTFFADLQLPSASEAPEPAVQNSTTIISKTVTFKRRHLPGTWPFHGHRFMRQIHKQGKRVYWLHTVGTYFQLLRNRQVAWTAQLAKLRAWEARQIRLGRLASCGS